MMSLLLRISVYFLMFAIGMASPATRDLNALAKSLLEREPASLEQLRRLSNSESNQLVDPLIEAIKAEKDIRKRGLGIWALGHLTAEVDKEAAQRAMQFLVDLMALQTIEDRHREDSYDARVALIWYREDSFPFLIKAMEKHGLHGVFWHVLESLVQRNDDELVRNVVSELQNHSPSVRRGVVIALRALHPSRRNYLPEILKAFDEERNRELRGQMTAIFFNWGPAAEEAVPHLIRALRDAPADDYVLKRSAASALGRIGKAASDAVPVLSTLLTNTSCRVREAAAGALALIDSPEARAALDGYEHCEIVDI